MDAVAVLVRVTDLQAAFAAGNHFVEGCGSVVAGIGFADRAWVECQHEIVEGGRWERHPGHFGTEADHSDTVERMVRHFEQVVAETAEVVQTVDCWETVVVCLEVRKAKVVEGTGADPVLAGKAALVVHRAGGKHYGLREERRTALEADRSQVNQLVVAVVQVSACRIMTR